MNIRHINDKGFIFIYLGVVFFYTLLLGLQGLDMTDEGFCLSGYQLLFEYPSAVEPLFLCYNSVLVGAIWNYFFGFLGIWGFRLLASLCTVLIAIVVYDILIKAVNRWMIFWGVMIILFSRHFVLVFHHNLFSAALCCISVCFILKSVDNNNKNELYSVFAGFFIGLNFFTRLPNVTMMSLFIVYFIYGIFTKEWKRVWIKLSFGIGGILIGVTLTLLLMQSLGHLSIYFKSLSSLFTTASSSDSNHSLSNLLRVFLGSYYIVLRQVVSICSFPCIAYVICSKISNTKIKYFLLLIILILYSYKLWVINRGAYTLYAFSFISLFIYLQKKANVQDICLVVASILVMLFLPLGSDGAIENMGPYCIWLSFPLSLGLISKRISEYGIFSKFTWLFSLFLFLFLTSITTQHLVLTMTSCYSDNGLRYKKIWRPNHPLITVRTDYKKCEILDDLFYHLNPYIDKGTFLLCWQSVPMIHYLTHTYPYLNNTWPWTFDSENLEKSFSKADKTHLPVVLCNKSAIAKWSEFDDEWDSENAIDQWNFNSSKAQIFHRFLQSNNYYIVWENDLFRILLPPSY